MCKPHPVNLEWESIHESSQN